MGLKCFNCVGKGTKCFVDSKTQSGKADTYTLVCEDCGEVETRDVPFLPTGTTCPFCCKSDEEHEQMTTPEPEAEDDNVEEDDTIVLDEDGEVELTLDDE